MLLGTSDAPFVAPLGTERRDTEADATGAAVPVRVRPTHVVESALVVLELALGEVMRSLVGVIGTDGVFASPVAEIWVESTPHLLGRASIVIGETSGVPADVKCLLGSGARQDEAVRRGTSRAS